MVDKRAKYRWTRLPPYPDYSVSEDGRVKDRHKNELAVRLDADGRACVRMWVNGVRHDLPVNVLVARAFHGPRSARYRVTHLNGDEGDCRAENVAWAELPDDFARMVHDTSHLHLRQPRRLDASALVMVCATYSAEYGTNISTGGQNNMSRRTA